MAPTNSRVIPTIAGAVMTVNFVAFWALPYLVLGLSWKNFLHKYLFPIYDALDKNKYLRAFAVNYIYTKPEYADYFTISVITILNSTFFLGLMFYWQLSYGYLPWWLIHVYYFSWVGIGARIMGAAYALAHREGHYQGMYKSWIRHSIGSIFESWLGMFYGNLPYNFSTSHIFIHHRLDAGCGDTFYMWDIDRSNFWDFLLYAHRIFLYMTGYTNYLYFKAHGQESKAKTLVNGMKRYALTIGVILLITRSPSFIFWVMIQPLMCMSYFLALLNVSLHAFIEYDTQGRTIDCINSLTILDGPDDYFGEDDHMAHHHHPVVFYRDLKTHQSKQEDMFRQYHASIFQKISILELSVFIVFQLWDKLAEYYVDYSGQLSKEDIIELLKKRSQRTEISYEEYNAVLLNPSREKLQQLREQIVTKVSNSDYQLPLKYQQISQALLAQQNNNKNREEGNNEEEEDDDDNDDDLKSNASVSTDSSCTSATPINLYTNIHEKIPMKLTHNLDMMKKTM